jgi:hypothetical protein
MIQLTTDCLAQSNTFVSFMLKTASGGNRLALIPLQSCTVEKQGIDQSWSVDSSVTHNTYASYVYFTGLSPSTNYRATLTFSDIYAQITVPFLTNIPVDDSITTQYTIMPRLTFGSVVAGQDTIHIKHAIQNLSGLYNDDYGLWKYRTKVYAGAATDPATTVETYVNVAGTLSPQTEITGLQPATTYRVFTELLTPDGQISTLIDTATTTSALPLLACSNSTVTTSYVTCRISPATGSTFTETPAHGLTLEAFDNSSWREVDVPTYVFEGDSLLIDGLTSATTYRLSLRITGYSPIYVGWTTEYGAAVQPVTPSPPPSASASITAPGVVTVSWPSYTVATGVTSHIVTPMNGATLLRASAKTANTPATSIAFSVPADIPYGSYSFAVATRSSGKYVTTATVTVEDTSKPKVTDIGVTTSSATITWSLPPDTSTCKLEYKLESSNDYTIVASAVSPHTIPGLPMYTPYHVRVRATLTDNSEVLSPVVNFRTAIHLEQPTGAVSAVYVYPPWYTAYLSMPRITMTVAEIRKNGRRRGKLVSASATPTATAAQTTAALYTTTTPGYTVPSPDVLVVVVAPGGTVDIPTSTLTAVGTSVYVPINSGESIAVTNGPTSAPTTLGLVGTTPTVNGEPVSLGDTFSLSGVATTIAALGSLGVQPLPYPVTYVGETADGHQFSLSVSREVAPIIRINTGALVPSDDITFSSAGPIYVRNVSSRTTLLFSDVDTDTPDYMVYADVEIIIPTVVPVCFLADAPVLTPTGYLPISTIAVGDLVRTAAGRTVTVKRVFAKEYTAAPVVNPFVIPKGSFGALRALPISPNHGVMVAGKGMSKAKDLGLPRMKMAGSFTYYNLELEDWVRDNLVVAGVECESLAPAARVSMTKAEFGKFVKARYGPAAAALLRTVCFEEKDGSVSMPAL